MTLDNDGEIGLYCHFGYNRKKRTLKLRIGESNKKFDIPVFLKCKDGKFQDEDGNEVGAVEKASCSSKMVPEVKKVNDPSCSSLGADGRDFDLDSLFKVTIGWNITSIGFTPQVCCQSNFI